MLHVEEGDGEVGDEEHHVREEGEEGGDGVLVCDEEEKVEEVEEVNDVDRGELDGRPLDEENEDEGEEEATHEEDGVVDGREGVLLVVLEVVVDGAVLLDVLLTVQCLGGHVHNVEGDAGAHQKNHLYKIKSDLRRGGDR